MKYTLLLTLVLILLGCGQSREERARQRKIDEYYRAEVAKIRAEQAKALKIAKEQETAEIEEPALTADSTFCKSTDPADTVWINALNRIKLPSSIRPDRLINVYFKYNQTVKDHEVTARWFPFDTHTETGLLVMNFRNTRNGQAFQYTNFEKYHNFNTDRISFADGFKGHRNGDVYYFEYISPDSPDYQDDYKKYNGNSPISGYTPFQFTDVDFDGTDELLINDWVQGQGGNGYEVYKVNGNAITLVDYPPFDDIDNMTQFDRAKRQITRRIRDGVWWDSLFVYKAVNGKWTLTERKSVE